MQFPLTFPAEFSGDNAISLETLAGTAAEQFNRPIVPVTNAHLDTVEANDFRVLRLTDSGTYGNDGDHVAWINGQWQNLGTEATFSAPRLETQTLMDAESGNTYAPDDLAGGGGSGLTSLATGTVTLTSGGSPAHDATLGLALAETDDVSVVRVTPDSAGQVAANYGFSTTWWQVWDDAAGSKDVHLQVDWQTDPGSNLTVAYEVLQ